MPETANILALLADDTPETIREGAHLAGMARLKKAIPSLVGHITSSNIGVQDAVDGALRKIGGADVVNAVIPLLQCPEAPARNIAMDILRALGSSDVATLTALLHDEDVDIRIFVADILGSVGSVQAVAPLCNALLHDPEVNVRYQAAISLGTLAHKEAAECLNKALNDEEWVQFSVVEALTKLRVESSVDAMLKALEGSSDLVASTIVDALGAMGNIKAVPILLKRLESSPTPLCNKIVKAVVSILGEQSLCLLGAKECARLRGYMSHALADEDTEIQDAAIKGCAALGGAEATPSILALAAKLNPETQQERLDFVVHTLAKSGYSQHLENAVRNGGDATVQVALAVLSCLDDPAILPLLMDVFEKAPRDIQRTVIREIAARAGAEHQQFFLNVLASHNDGTVLRNALAFLGRNGKAEEVQNALIAKLSHPYADVKQSALEACIALRSKDIEQHLRGMLTHAEPAQRMMGAYSLGFFGSEALADVLKGALYDESVEVRKAAVEALGRDCPMSPRRSEMVKELLGDKNREVRMAVIEALGSCSDNLQNVCLTKGLDDDDPWVRARCAEKLGMRKTSAAVEPLVKMLAEENNLVVIKSIEALGAIGGEAAFMALLGLFEHPDSEIVRAAEEAVECIRKKVGE